MSSKQVIREAIVNERVLQVVQTEGGELYLFDEGCEVVRLRRRGFTLYSASRFLANTMQERRFLAPLNQPEAFR